MREVFVNRKYLLSQEALFREVMNLERQILALKDKYTLSIAELEETNRLLCRELDEAQQVVERLNDNHQTI